jgi:hypothetical protein
MRTASYLLRVLLLSGLAVICAPTQARAQHAPTTERKTFSTDFPLSGRLPDLLSRLARDRYLWKRHGDFLVFRPEDWDLVRRDALPPWPMIRDLRATAARNGGYLRPEDWLRLATLPRDVLDHMKEEFPDAGVERIGRVQILLRLAAQAGERERSLWAREGGAGWNDLSSTTRQVLRILLPRADVERTRIALRWITEEKPPRGVFHLGPAELMSKPVTLTFEPRKEVTEPED